MEIEPGGVEGPVIVVAVGRLEVAGVMEVRGIPKSTSEVGEKRKLRP